MSTPHDDTTAGTGEAPVRRRFPGRPLIGGIIIGAAAVSLVGAANHLTSSDPFCDACHVHPQATASWRHSTHYSNRSGMVVHCVECHLPPGGIAYWTQKARLGLRDAWGTVFKDREKIDWVRKSQPDHAATHVFKESCLTCHVSLFPATLSDLGERAHLAYEQDADEARCISCHLQVGHHDPAAVRGIVARATRPSGPPVFNRPAVVTGFSDFTERIPGTRVSFELVAIPGGTFLMGSPDTEPLRSDDEGPQHEVTVGPFWMGRAEVSWDEFEAWYRATSVEGRTDTRALTAEAVEGADAVTGATPPYGNPDQGWGRAGRPAITMTHHAAVAYCRWLSEVTGRTYRLPTEAEWEYACRGGTASPYFFEADPRRLDRRGFLTRLFGPAENEAEQWVIYAGTGRERTEPPAAVEPNPFGLVHMLGNVKEFCSDPYDPAAYAAPDAGRAAGGTSDRAGAEEYVVRGGSYRSPAAAIRCAARDRTRSEAWLRSDPQIPKSIWWYSDCTDVGFRVVCEYPSSGTLESPGENEKEPRDE